MTRTTADRTPPADPWDIRLSYAHEHHWAADPDDGPAFWRVSADIRDDEGGDEGPRPAASHVGDIEFVLMDLFDTRDPFGVLDGHDGDLGVIAETIFSGRRGRGDLAPDLDERLESFGTGLLILNRAKLAPQWRGFGYGVILTGLAIKRLSGGCRAVVCYPAPLADNDDLDDAVRRAATARLSEVWAQLGFEHYRNGVHVLDLALVTLDEALKELRARLEAQS
ncbi:hypothetical protein LWC34_54680 [Kibdelosporangium philippinense]|uniref:N-acetyltransferase domain-containing protein n=1 Tax=Kibdelosporangium philippinense TaxID=211113 RepID=A0ABS8ZVS1_9PSEU|nr:hypothetical protein [Kibdelosporangium philippinense]MCE7011806.1 hypothetical protein [Kibdelosporangium philippinense]